MFFPIYGSGIEYCLWVGTFVDGVEAPEWDEDLMVSIAKGFIHSEFLNRNIRPKKLLDMFVGEASFGLHLLKWSSMFWA